MQLTLKDLTPDQLKIYISLQSAKQRCTNPNKNRYERYGGRGIQYRLEDTKSRIQIVLEQEQAWQECKRKHPDEPVTINRIDNNGHYIESNIQWVPMSENTRQMLKDNPHKPWNTQERIKKARAMGIANRKPVKCLTSGEVYKSATEAAKELKISLGNISNCCNGKVKSAGKYKGRPRIWQFI